MTEKQATRRRFRHVSARADVLKRDLVQAGKKVRDLEARVESAKKALAGGTGSAAGAAKAVKALEEARAEAAHLGEALVAVDAERQAAGAVVDAAAQARQRKRQEKAAESLHQEAEALIQTFIEGVAGMLAPLVRRKEIATMVARDYPLARHVDPLDLKALATALRAATGGDRRQEDPLAFVVFLRRVLAGPVGYAWIPAARPLLGELEQKYGLADR